MRHNELGRRDRVAQTSSVIAILFLLAQFLGTAHAAHHGDPSHQHDGMPCAIQFVVETAKGLLNAEAPCHHTPLITADIPFFGPASQVYLSRDISNRSIRGPPSFLF